MTISLSEFVKFFPLRANNLAWFFGAGSSVSAGVPSAYDLIWDFKRRIYCADQSYPLSLFNNLTDPALREQIQTYFDTQGNCPKVDSTEEYSYYFERAFNSPIDRSEYIGQQTSGMQLTYGHKVIGILMKHRFINIIFTTNFDKAFENVASTKFSKLEDWFAADIENSENGMRFLQSGKRPIIVKLHGDYFSSKLKNTTAELQNQDQKLREMLSLSLNTKGLCVMGYSGRDSSVMDVFSDALKTSSSFPGGLYWFIKAGSEPLPAVVELIKEAKRLNKQAELVEIENFDTAWADIIKGIDTIPDNELGPITRSYNQPENKPLPATGKNYPVIRLNGIPITQYPATARLYKCDAGNTKEVIEFIKTKKGDVIATRKKHGIVGFGSDDEFIKCFSDYGDYELELYQITSRDLFFDDSGTKEMILTALMKALVRDRPLRYLRKRDRQLIIPDPKQTGSAIFEPLKSAVGQITGYLPRTNLLWTIAVELKIQYVLNQPILQLLPTIIVAKTSDQTEKKLVAPFVKEATARWYNQKFDSILNAWLKVILNNQETTEFSTFAIANGVNATFQLSQSTAFSRSM